jgi:hypothetical protein
MTYSTAVCTGEKLLMMDRETVRNMYSLIPRIKFEKLVHIFGFYYKKFIMMHGHMNVKFYSSLKRRKKSQKPQL